MKHKLDGVIYEFDLSPLMSYIRRTGDYDMENATVDDWDWGSVWSIVLDDGIEAEDDYVIPRAHKEALLAFWKDNYDPTP